MSYRARSEGRRFARRLAMRPRPVSVVKMSTILKWHYPQATFYGFAYGPTGPKGSPSDSAWWTRTAVKFGWMTIAQAAEAAVRWHSEET